MPDRSVVLVLGALFLFTFTINLFKAKGKNSHRPPPDPPESRLPIVLPWQKYHQWFKSTNNSLMSLSLPGSRKVLLISGMDALHALYTTRSAIYSTRPMWRMAHLIGRENNVAFTPYNARLKTARRFLIGALGQKEINNWGALIDREVTLLLNKIVQIDESDRGTKVPELIHVHISDVVTLLTYGHRATPQYIAESEAIGRDTGLSLIPGKWAIEGLPFLQYLPSILPGMAFKRWAIGAKVRFERLIGKEFEDVQEAMKNKTAPQCFVSDILSSGINPQDIPVLRSTAGSLYSAATDTTTAILQSALHLLSLHPTIQQTAYNHLSSYTRPPTISDEPSLPYITAIIRELHRFRPVVNLISHAPLSDDVYENWRIEKGTWVMGNVWSVCHDEEIYPNPEVFNPERHLDPSGKIASKVRDPRSVTFGFGRRKCPGEHFANAHVFLFLARVIWLFEILPGTGNGTGNGSSGKEKEKKSNADLLEYSSAFISAPKKENFNVRLRLRNEGLRESLL